MRTPRSCGARCAAPLVAVLSIMAAGAPGSVLAQPVVSVATTVISARRQGKVVVADISWACSGTRCTTSTPPTAVAATLSVCQGLAREVGPIGSFVVANRSLTGSELKECNSVIPATAAAAPIRLTMPDPAPKPPAAAASRSYPVGVRTEVLTATGTGRLTDRLPFTPKNVRTDVLAATGTGTLATRLPFTPKSIRTEPLTVTGTGVVR